MLITIEQVLSKDEVRQFRAHLDGADWQDGTRSAGTLARAVKSNLQIDDASELAVSLGNHIVRCISQRPTFIAAALPREIYPPKFNCYQDGGAYGLHIDSAVMPLPGTRKNLRTDLAATVFLSEPDDYDGGELEIETAFGAQCVKLAAGDMVLYPASSLHRVTPVTRGARLASFFWIESLVANEADRTMLFDLDQTIQALTPALGATDERLLRLTGVYHNLLRRCAIT
ncbi:Fe2+-dependent dioxygenase [Massilia sp. CF038]|uniref:Fe2+-dependent dioxygenase n=1 Tax=Massilia sp. CF038 TaxID=1881045 RepID=UPI000921313D|nr:Fe2+-dependent dioxygenase [Massilia sp. CF038]SHG39182.1 PKHD-type hydroxylase [Massilia sp. CF038]